MRLGDVAQKIRSKNAGPFWVSVDVFCGDAGAYETIRTALQTAAVAALFNIPPAQMKRFEIAPLKVIKFSFPRTIPQGARLDRDMHGAQFAQLAKTMQILG